MSSCRADPMPIETRLQHVTLESTNSGRGLLPHEVAFSPNTGSLLSSTVVDDRTESAMRQCFSEAFDKEVEYLTSLNIVVTHDRKRQILADILVWAEVTQTHYDTPTRSFVLEPNQHDESFQRVGKFLREAKQEHGL